MSHSDAEPYLRTGQKISQEPLALAVLVQPGADVHTALPHTKITIPCRCTIDHEPVLVDGILVQIGTGHVEKKTSQALVQIDTLDVVTLKVLVYKDEIKGDWSKFCVSPIRHLVSLLPKLRRCTEANCTCEAWHNPENLEVRDPILDVWRRQFLRTGFKPSPAAKADIFSVCLRVPRVLLDPLLTSSGCHGAYCEPRSADRTEILTDYTVIWTPRHSLQDLLHLMRTNPAVTGLARLGDRRGLRVMSHQAKALHNLVKPDSVYLPNGPKIVFTVGPMPYGVDRLAVGKILQQAGWECRPLQPTTPCPGRGAMWLVQSTEDPPNAIIHTSHGEIVIVGQRYQSHNPHLPLLAQLLRWPCVVQMPRPMNQIRGQKTIHGVVGKQQRLVSLQGHMMDYSRWSAVSRIKSSQRSRPRSRHQWNRTICQTEFRSWKARCISFSPSSRDLNISCRSLVANIHSRSMPSKGRSTAKLSSCTETWKTRTRLSSRCSSSKCHRSAVS